MARLVFVLLIAACSTPADEGSGPDAGTTSEAQLPPQGHAAITGWLADGAYLAWTCEAAPQPARPPGAHGATRICSNTLLAGSTAGPFPVGAASVKELHRDGSIIGFAVGRKLEAGWYWYEEIGPSVVADGVGAGLCAGCHADAPRDHVFVQVR